MNTNQNDMEYLNSNKVNFFFFNKIKMFSSSHRWPKLSDEDFLNHHIFRFATPEILKKICSIHFFDVQLLCLKCWEETKMNLIQILLSGDLHSSRKVKAKITRWLGRGPGEIRAPCPPPGRATWLREKKKKNNQMVIKCYKKLSGIEEWNKDWNTYVTSNEFFYLGGSLTI